jgi:hypothetical protein
MEEDACFCLPPTLPGACCLPDGTCQELMQFECFSAGGGFAGEGVVCSADLCTDPGDFVVEECATPFEDISGSGTALALTDDDGAVVPVGFSFEFYSDTHTMIGVSSNGFLSFGPNLVAFGDVAIPSTLSPNDLIAPLWDDLNPATGGSVHYQTLGTEPNRRFVAQWTGVPEFVATGANTLQALLFEGSNVIEFRYGALTLTDGTIGVEHKFGGIGTAIDRASIAEGDCVRLLPVELVSTPPAPAPALDARAVAILVAVLAAVALTAMRRRTIR